MSEFIAYCRLGIMVQPQKHSLVQNLAITLPLGQFVLNKLKVAQYLSNLQSSFEKNVFFIISYIHPHRYVRLNKDIKELQIHVTLKKKSLYRTL